MRTEILVKLDLYPYPGTKYISQVYYFVPLAPNIPFEYGSYDTYRMSITTIMSWFVLRVLGRITLNSNKKRNRPSALKNHGIFVATYFSIENNKNLQKLPTSATSQMITFYFENGSVLTMRTSGTEPKIKYYTEMIGSSREECNTKLNILGKSLNLTIS